MHYLDIFNRGYIEKTPIIGGVTPSDVNYLRRLFIYNKDSIEDYYQERNFAVKNTNILSRILEHFPIYLNYTDYRYLEFTDDRIKYLAKHFRFTSEIEKGIVHPGYFFGNENEEIIIAGYENFNLYECITSWKKDKCIYVLKHNRNDSKFLLPLGNQDGSKSGICSILINIPKLAIKFREFSKQQVINSNTDKITLNKNHFVIKYVLSTMMDDVIDHTLLNKIMDRFNNVPEVTPKYTHRFKLFIPTTQIDKYIDDTLEIITSKRLDFINILHNIKLMFSEDALTLLSFPDLGMTRQIKWALLLSRIDYMLFLYNVCKTKDLSRTFINDWKLLVTRMERDNNIEGFFSYQEEKLIKEKLYIIKNM